MATTLFRLFVNNLASFSTQQAPPAADVQTTIDPIRVGEYCRVIEIGNGRLMKLDMWDTAGAEKQFLTLNNWYFRDADAVLIVFDVACKQSFLNATTETLDDETNGRGFKTWLKEVHYRLDDARLKNTVIVLVGNKNDLCKRQVDSKDAKDFAKKNQLDYIETSSREDNNVDQLFFLVCRRLFEKEVALQPSPAAQASLTDTIIRLDRPTNSSSGCCRRRRQRHI